MQKDKPFADADYLLEKFPGKGGWTYAVIPEAAPDRNNPFGWVKVKGSIDGYPLKQYKLMPMGEGRLFLPVKAAIRKAIRKQAGDRVRVVLFYDSDPLEIPPEIRACFENEPPALYETFLSLPESHRKEYLQWIYEAKKEETKARRIAGMMERLGTGKASG